MKKFAMVAFLVVSSLGMASEGEIGNIRQAQRVNVNSVQKVATGEFGFPSTIVKVEATFGNKCEVPNEDELVAITNYSKNYDQLIIALGNESERICPRVYAPVTVTINLGQFTRPNDGSFSKITVNGKVAR